MLLVSIPCFCNTSIQLYMRIHVLSAAVGSPIIIEQPQNIFVLLGDTAEFSVTASTEASVFQWFFNGLPLDNVDTDRIQGFNTAILTISEVTIGDRGTYQVRVSNDAGFADSDIVSLMIIG